MALRKLYHPLHGRAQNAWYEYAVDTGQIKECLSQMTRTQMIKAALEMIKILSRQQKIFIISSYAANHNIKRVCGLYKPTENQIKEACGDKELNSVLRKIINRVSRDKLCGILKSQASRILEFMQD